jgi:hypothetical protein
MKTQNQMLSYENEQSGNKPQPLFLLVVALAFTLTAYTRPAFYRSAHHSITDFETIKDDSTAESTSFGDTIVTLLDGGDTIYLLSDAIDSGYTGRVMTIEDIIVKLTSYQNPTVGGVYGVNLQNVFNNGHAPFEDNDEYLSGESPWDYLVNLAPQSLRYPSGTSSRFWHPLGSMNTDNGTPHALKKNGGNGIRLEDIVAYYDYLDEELTHPSYAEIYNSILADEFADETWILDEFKSDFLDLFNEWNTQLHFDPTDPDLDELSEQPLYINDLIALIKQIETGNPGLRVKLLYTVNIFSEPVSTVISTMDYLQNDELNDVYDVYVYGIELGNECYFDINDQFAGFGCYDGYSAFDHYWAYITGVEDYNIEFGTAGDLILDDVLSEIGMTGLGPDGVYQNHNYIYALSDNEITTDIKIGLPARNADVPDGAFIVTPEDDLVVGILSGGECNAWNMDLYAKYSSMINGEPAFDAIVAHQYYTSQNAAIPEINSNWGNIPIGLNDVLTEGDNCLDNDDDDALHNNFTTEYTYLTEDTRLSCAYKGIIGHPDFYNTGNFNQFTRTRHLDAFGDLSDELSLGESEPYPKEVWVSEWNIKNNNSFEGDDKININKRINVYNNSFVHSYVIQEQLLNMIAFNSISNDVLREDFIQIATLQNYLGGSEIQLLTQANRQDYVAYGLDTDCMADETFIQYIPRTLYHSYKLANQIGLGKLNYVRSNKIMFASNINQAPTMFITPYNPAEAERQVYGYFTNVKNTSQTIIVRPGTLIPISLTGTTAEIHCIQGSQLYSRSGKGSLFDINNYYASCLAPDGPDNFYEINGEIVITEYEDCPDDMPTGSMCVVVPAYSIGYFVFSYNPYLRIGEEIERFQLFPNPSSSHFVIQQTDLTAAELIQIRVQVFNFSGMVVKDVQVVEGERIKIDDLPSGMYSVFISGDTTLPEMHSLIKIE